MPFLPAANEITRGGSDSLLACVRDAVQLTSFCQCDCEKVRATLPSQLTGETALSVEFLYPRQV